MKGDFSKLSFKPKNHYASVRMQQGRIQIDSDWNEEMDIFDHRVQTETIDFIGGSGAPAGQDGFKIEIQNNNWTISKGRYYVNGLLCENESTINFTAQPDFPNATLPSSDGLYLAYLDVWQRGITAIEQPDIIESALNGIDTTTRLQNIAQVKYVTLDGTDLSAFDCNSVFDPQATSGTAFNNQQIWQTLTAPSTGQLTPFVDSTPSFDNDLYRIEIHQGGDPQTATFKWASNNASLAARIKSISLTTDTLNNTVTAIIQIYTTQSLNLNFEAGQWVELNTNTRELLGQKGLFGRISSVNSNTLNVTMIDALINADEFVEGKICVWKNAAASILPASNTYNILSIAASNSTDTNSDAKITLDVTAPSSVTIGQYVQLTNNTAVQNQQNGILAPIQSIDSSRKIITINIPYSFLTTSTLNLINFVGSPTTSVNTTEQIFLENGLSIQFSGESYKTSDYWLIPSRAVTNTIEWPTDSDNQFIARYANGIEHFYEKLAVIKLEHVDDELQMTANDCRTVFSPLSSFANLRAVEADPAAPEAAIYIDNQGHVGIGTGKQALSEKLQVAGTLALEDNLKFISHTDHQTEVLSLVAPFAIRGTGLKNNAPAFVKIANRIIYSTTNVSGTKRGLNLIILDKQTFNVVGNIVNYDTFDDSTGTTAANNLADALNTLTNQQIGILISFDAWLIDNNITAYLKQAFINRGLYRAAGAKNNIGDGFGRFPYAAIFEGEVNQATNKAIEVLQNPYVSSPHADLNGWFTDGTFTSSGDTVPLQPNPTPYSVPLANNIGSINSNWIGNRWLPSGYIANSPFTKFGMGSAVVQEKIYIIGGGTNPNSASSEVFVFNTITKTWSTCASMPTSRVYFAISAVNNKIYVFGGSNGSNSLNSMEIFDPIANTWTSNLPLMPFSARAGLSSCVINGIIYVMGGGEGSAYSDLFAFNPADSSWNQCSNMPTARSGACVHAVNNKIYVIGGFNSGTSYPNTIDIFQPGDIPGLGGWSTITSPTMPTPRTLAASCVVGQKIYIFGGFNLSDSNSFFSAYNNVDVFDCNKNNWTSSAPLPSPLHSAAACQQDNMIYVMGGATSPIFSFSTNTINVFLP